MEKRSSKFKLTTSHYKVLQTVSLLNEMGYYPLKEGVNKILKGEDDEEIENFKDFPTYKTLISFPSKKIARYVLMLYRYHYLDKVYDPITNELYLKITPLGETSLIKYKKQHKAKYVQKKTQTKPTIVYLGKK